VKTGFAVHTAVIALLGTALASHACAQDAAPQAQPVDFAARVEKGMELVRAGDLRGARAALVQLLAEEPLREKLSSYASILQAAGSQWGNRTHREEIRKRAFPRLTQDEARLIYRVVTLTATADNPPDRCGLDSPEPLLHLGALNGHAPSQFQLGLLLTRGTPCWERSLEEAAYWYEKAAAQEHPEARVNLAIARLLGQGVAANEGAAIEMLTASAAERHPRAQFMLGTLHVTGRGVRKSQRRAIELFRASAEQGFRPAQTSLGKILWERALVQEEWDEAGQWLRRAAERGDPEAQYALGRAYNSGWGGELARSGQGEKWWQEAARQGHVGAQAALGLFYWESGDFGRAIEWLTAAAERNQPRAQTYLGYAYLEGKGLPQDSAAAISWWRRAAAQNDSRAEEALGWAYENGRGVPRDIGQARDWYRRAATHGSMGATEALKGSEFERLAREERQIFTVVAFFSAIAAVGIAEQEARADRINAMLAAGGEWKSKYFCEKELWDVTNAFGIPDVEVRTYCYDRNGVGHWADGWLDPCGGVEGWCDGVGLGPR